MESCRILIPFICMSCIIGSFGEIIPGHINCFKINDVSHNTSKFDDRTVHEILNGSTTISTDFWPEAPKDLIFSVNGSYPTIIWWTNPRLLRGLDYLKHILLRVEQEYVAGEKTFRETEYSLLNVSGKEIVNTTLYSYNCTRFKPGAYRMEAVLWFYGNIELESHGNHGTRSNRGKQGTRSNDMSRSRTMIIGKENIIPALRQANLEADDCICSSSIVIRISALPSEGAIKTSIRGFKIPDRTKVEIQLVRDEVSRKIIVRRLNVTGLDIQRPFLKKFEVRGGKSYYIRVIRYCQKSFRVSCGNDEAESLRSESIFLESGSSHSPMSSSKEEQGDKATPKCTQTENDHGLTSCRLVPFHKDTLKHILQIAASTFLIGICIIAEVALVMGLTTVLFCRRKTSEPFYKKSVYVTVDNRGKATTKLVKRRRIAIIFTKDSTEHEEAVYCINNMLRNKDIETVPFDENFSPEMRANWIQAAENIITDFEAIMFVISPLLYTACKKEATPFTVEDNKGKKPQDLNKFPSVVLNALKNSDAWAVTRKTKIITVCIAETKRECKQLSVKMRREHPIVFKDKIYFLSLKNKQEVNSMKCFQSLVLKLITSLENM